MSLTDVRVINLGKEPDLWRAHGIFFGKEEFQPEDAVYSPVNEYG